MARMTEVVELPSRGLLYDTKSVTIQNMTVAEEKYLYSSNTADAINKILKACIVDDIDVDSLSVPDKHFILLRLRVLTYGEKYPVGLRCLSCKNKWTEHVDLSTLTVNELPDDFKNSRKVKLPVSGDELSIIIPSSKSVNEISENASKKAKQLGIPESEARYIYEMMPVIKSVNGDEMFPDEMYSYISEMHAKDSSFLKKQISKIKLGYDTSVECDCPNCGNKVKFELPMTADFFRADFDEEE